MVNQYGKDYLLGEIEYRLLVQNAKLNDNDVQTKVKVLEAENGAKTIKSLAKKMGITEDDVVKRARSLAAEEKNTD